MYLGLMVASMGFVFEAYADIRTGADASVKADASTDIRNSTEPKTKTPKWQIGLAVGGQDLPHYRGSDQRTQQVLPVPLIFYSGKILKVNRDGARSELYKSKKIELNLSADAALNGTGEPNRARAGMPDLDSAFELGPSVNFLLYGTTFSRGLALRFPIRGVMTLGDEGLKYRGALFNPRLTWRNNNVYRDWRLSVSLGGIWATNSYHDYYYSVSEAFANELRPAYDARAGFAGYSSKLSMRRQQGGWLYGFSIRYDKLNGAVFADSPLVLTKDYAAFSLGIGKTFWVF